LHLVLLLKTSWKMHSAGGGLKQLLKKTEVRAQNRSNGITPPVKL